MSKLDWRVRGVLSAVAGGLLLALATTAIGQDGRRWKPLADDGIHDAKGDGIQALKAPGTMLQKLPASSSPDQVNWVEAQRKGLIKPRSGIGPKAGTDATVHDSEVVLNPNGSMKPVLFRHQEHTQLLECDSCHEALFKMEEGASGISKVRMGEGEQCGLCHRSVAFPLTECDRCHSGSWDAKPPAQQKPAAAEAKPAASAKPVAGTKPAQGAKPPASTKR